MSRTVLYQIAAVALVVGAVLTAAGNLLAPRAVPDGGRQREVLPDRATVLLGGLLVMAGWPAVYLRQRAESGVLGFAGMVAVLMSGLLLTVAFPLIQILIYPWIADHEHLRQDPQRRADGVQRLLRAYQRHRFDGRHPLRSRHHPGQGLLAPTGIGLIVLAAASFVLGFLSIPGGGGIHMSWWWATTGTFGVVAYMVALAWYGIELFRIADTGPTTGT